MFLVFPCYYCNKTIDGAVPTCLHHTSHLCTFDSYRPLLIWNTQRHWESSLLWPSNEHSSFLFGGNACNVSIPTSPQFPPKRPNYFYAPFDKNDKYTMNPSTRTCCLTTCMMSDNVMPRHVHWCSHSGKGLELIHTIHETHVNRAVSISLWSISLGLSWSVTRVVVGVRSALVLQCCLLRWSGSTGKEVLSKMAAGLITCTISSWQRVTGFEGCRLLVRPTD